MNKKQLHEFGTEFALLCRKHNVISIVSLACRDSKNRVQIGAFDATKTTDTDLIIGLHDVVKKVDGKLQLQIAGMVRGEDKELDQKLNDVFKNNGKK